MQGLLVNIKRHIIFLFLLILLVFLLWIRLFVVPKSQKESKNISPTPNVTTLTPPVQVTENNNAMIVPAPNISNSQDVAYTYSDTEMSLPQNLSVFTYEEPVILTLDNATKLASLFDFSSEPFLQGKDVNNYPYYTFKNEGKTFITGGSFPLINYIRGKPEEIPQTLLPATFDVQILSQNAVDELNNVGVANIEKESPDVSYYKVSPYAPSLNEYILEETTNPEEALYIKFSFPLTIEGFPIISQEYKKSTSYVILDSTGALYELFSYIIPPTSSTTINTLSFSQIVNNINQNAIIVSAESSLDINSETSQTYIFTEVDLTNPQIYYFLPSSFNYNLSPYVLFRGISFDTSLNQEVETLVLVPVN